MLSAVARFIGWWGRELAALVPGPLRSAFSTNREMLIVGIGDASLSLRAVRGSKVRQLGELDTGSKEGGAIDSAVRALLRGVNLKRCAVALRLPQREALRTTVTLPLAAQENLREVLQFEMDRVTPFRADAVYFGYRLLSVDRERQQIRVAVTVVPRQAVDRALVMAAGWGIEADIVDVEDADAVASEEANLLAATDEGRGGRAAADLLTAVLVAAALVLLAATIWVPLDRERQLVEQLRVEARELRKNADVVTALREKIEQADRLGRFLAERKLRHPTRTEIVNEITRLLPDDTWLQRLKIGDKDIDISGFSSKSTALLALLEGSDLFQGVRFRSPVTQDPRTGVERFNLAIDLSDVAGAK